MKYEYLLQTPSLCFGCVSLYLTYDHLLQFIQICGSAVCFNQHKNFTCLVCQDKQSFLKKASNWVFNTNVQENSCGVIFSSEVF